MGKLILMRHGQSVWNKQNLFTGWVDIPLTEKGIEEAREGGKKIQTIPIDVVFTSSLIRAQMTVVLALLHHESGRAPVFTHFDDPKMKTWTAIHSEETAKKMIPVFAAQELNERMYGKLQGLNKAETAEKFGAEQVQIWRRSYDIAPPEGESLAMTAKRTLPFFETKIVPHLQKGENVFIAAHGNSLRAIVMHLEQLSKEEVLKLELETGEPLLYQFQENRYERLNLPG